MTQKCRMQLVSDLNLLRDEFSKSLWLPLNSCRRIPFLMSMFSYMLGANNNIRHRQWKSTAGQSQHAHALM